MNGKADLKPLPLWEEDSKQIFTVSLHRVRLCHLHFFLREAWQSVYQVKHQYVWDITIFYQNNHSSSYLFLSQLWFCNSVWFVTMSSVDSKYFSIIYPLVHFSFQFSPLSLQITNPWSPFLLNTCFFQVFLFLTSNWW